MSNGTGIHISPILATPGTLPATIVPDKPNDLLKVEMGETMKSALDAGFLYETTDGATFSCLDEHDRIFSFNGATSYIAEKPLGFLDWHIKQGSLRLTPIGG